MLGILSPDNRSQTASLIATPLIRPLPLQPYPRGFPGSLVATLPEHIKDSVTTTSVTRLASHAKHADGSLDGSISYRRHLLKAGPMQHEEKVQRITEIEPRESSTISPRRADTLRREPVESHVSPSSNDPIIGASTFTDLGLATHALLPDPTDLDGSPFGYPSSQLECTSSRSDLVAGPLSVSPSLPPAVHHDVLRDRNKSPVSCGDSECKKSSTSSASEPQSDEEYMFSYEDKATIMLCINQMAGVDEQSRISNRHSITASEACWDPRHEILGPHDWDPLTVNRLLGYGAVGVVEEVRHENSSKTFVRKRVQLRFGSATRMKQIVQTEAVALADLTHPHIVQLFGSYEDRTHPQKAFYCLLITPVGDNDLKEFLQRCIPGHYPAPNGIWTNWLWRWFGCLASALTYIHSHGIRHEDIKPSNIIHRGGDIFFTDFSSSTRFSVGETTSTESPVRSSIMYASPEVAEPVTSDDERTRHGLGSDIFSLGCVFSEMLAVLGEVSIEDYYDHLRHVPGGRSKASGGPASLGFLYSERTYQVDEWFQSHWNGNFFQNCIKPMLQVNRRSRPTAREVLRRVLQEALLNSACPCYTIA